MALSNLLIHAQEVTGITDRTQLLRYVNRAAQEAYDNWDLPGSCDERSFSIDVSTHFVTLPWYVDQVRGIKRRDFADRVQLVDIRHRYRDTPWIQPFLQWRVHPDQVLERNLSQASQLVFTLQATESTSLDITIVGQTATSSRRIETLTIEAGSTSVTSTNQWLQDSPFGIQRLSKSRRTDTDVLVTQSVDSTRVASIAAPMLNARNKRIQVYEDGQFLSILGDIQSVDVLFKWPFIPLEDDAEEFLNTDRFDVALNWKIQSHWYALKEETYSLAIAAEAKCKDQLQKLAMNLEDQTEMYIRRGRNPYEGAIRSMRRGRYAYYYGPLQ